MNALNKLIQERFADITQGASADVYPLTAEELKFIEFCASGAAQVGAAIGTDQIDNLICQLLENRKPSVFKCRCNKCDKVYVDKSGGLDTNQPLPDLGELELEMFEDEGGAFYGCPECKTDEYLMDIKDI